MARNARVDVGNEIYHVLNRAVGRAKIFTKPADYRIFEDILREATDCVDMRILAYAIMPNHWHLVLYPRNDGDLGIFMHQLTNAHTRRVHADTHTTGTGPLYQGRYKSFLGQDDAHFLTLVKYVERNPVRALLARKCEEWQWGSAWRRAHGSPEQQSLLSESPVPFPKNYREWINTPEKEVALIAMRDSVRKGKPFGGDIWVEKMINKYKLESTLRNPGRPSKN